MTHVRTNLDNANSSGSTSTRKSRSLFSSSDESDLISSSDSIPTRSSRRSLFSSSDEVTTISLTDNERALKDTSDEDFIEVRGNGLYAYEEQASALLELNVQRVCNLFNLAFNKKLTELISFLLTQYKKIPKTNLNNDVEALSSTKDLFYNAFYFDKSNRFTLNKNLYILFGLATLTQEENKSFLFFIQLFSYLANFRLYLNHLLHSNLLLEPSTNNFISQIKKLDANISEEIFKHRAHELASNGFANFVPGITYCQIETGKRDDNTPLEAQELLKKIEKKLTELALLSTNIDKAIKGYASSIESIQYQLDNFLCYLGARKQADCNFLKIELEACNRFSERLGELRLSKTNITDVHTYISELNESFKRIFTFYEKIDHAQNDEEILDEQLLVFIKQKKAELSDKIQSLNHAIEECKLHTPKIEELSSNLLKKKQETYREKAAATPKLRETPSTSTSSRTQSSSTLTFAKLSRASKGKEVKRPKENSTPPNGPMTQIDERTAKITAQQNSARGDWAELGFKKQISNIIDETEKDYQELIEALEKDKKEEICAIRKHSKSKLQETWDRVSCIPPSELEGTQKNITPPIEQKLSSNSRTEESIDANPETEAIFEELENLSDALKASLNPPIKKNEEKSISSALGYSEIFKQQQTELFSTLYTEIAKYIKNIQKTGDIAPPAHIIKAQKSCGPVQNTYEEVAKQIAILKEKFPIESKFRQIGQSLWRAGATQKFYNFMADIKCVDTSSQEIKINPELVEHDLCNFFKFMDEIFVHQRQEKVNKRFKDTPTYELYKAHEQEQLRELYAKNAARFSSIKA